MTASTEALLEEVGREAKVGGWRFDVATGRRTWTSEVARIHEVDPDDPDSMELGLAAYSVESRARIDQAIRDAIDRRRAYELELELTTPSGAHKWTRTIGRPVDHGGTVVEVRGVIQDITDRRRAENAQRHGDELLRMFVESSPGVVAMFDRDMRYLAVSRRFAADLRIADADLRGRSHYEVFPEIPEHWRDIHRRCLAGATEQGRDDEFRRSDGTTDWVTWEIRPWRDTNGAIGGIVLFSEVVTERHLTEQTLGLQAAALQAAANAILITGANGLIKWVNAAFTSLTGYAADEVIGRDPKLLSSGLQSPEFYRELWATIRAGGVWHGELINRRKDGTLYHEYETITPVRDAHGTISHFVAVKQDISERIRNDAAMRESEARLRLALDGLPIPIGLASIDGRVLMYNTAFTERFGYTREDIPLVPDWIERAYPDPAIRAQVQAQWREDLTRGTSADPQPRVYPVTCKDGSVRDVQIVARQVGEMILAVFHDVTATRRAAAALAESEERQRLALETAELATWRNDLTTGMTELDPRARELFGFARSVVPTTELFALQHPDDAITREEFDAGIRSGGLRATRRVLLANGEMRWVLSQGKVHYTGDGDERRPEFVTVIGHDITLERRAQDALRASEERYRTLVDSLDDIVFTLDSSGRITFVNRAVASFGYRPEDCVGRSLTDFVHPDERERAIELNKQRLAGNLGGPVEYLLRDAAGKSRNVRIVTRRSADGSGLVGIAVDITAMRSAEEQLRAAQKMEAIGRLAGGVAHDFNNLLTAIMSCVELALGVVEENHPVSEDLHEIMHAATRAVGLTRQLLAFSRRQVLQPEPVVLPDLVAALAKMLERLIGEDIELRVLRSRDVTTAMVDRGQIEQVVMNLVVNARDAMPDGGRITISTETVTLDEAAANALELRPGLHVRLRVTDTGTGMDAATLARIFEPFFTTKEQGKGTGLGLSTVFGIVKQSKGSIAVDSTPGRGTTFDVYLPAEGQTAVVQPPLERLAPARGHETILVVEDEAPLRAVVVRVLRASGYRVLVAATPSEALRLASSEGGSVDLILTDVVMPEMNGRELATRLAPLCPSARILYTSGYTDDALLRSGVLGEEFLPKPFDPRTLSARIRSLLDGNTPEARAARGPART